MMSATDYPGLSDQARIGNKRLMLIWDEGYRLWRVLLDGFPSTQGKPTLHEALAEAETMVFQRKQGSS